MKITKREFMKSASLTALLGAFAPNLLLKKVEGEKLAEDKSTINIKKLNKTEGLEEALEVFPLTGNTFKINSVDVGEPINISSCQKFYNIIDTSLLEKMEYKPIDKDFYAAEFSVETKGTLKGYEVLNKAYTCGEAQEFEIIVGDTTFNFQGYVCSIETSGDVEGILLIESRIKIIDNIQMSYPNIGVVEI
jgi:hypothetical protein